MKKSTLTRKGFTFVEIMIVLCILLLLAAIAIPGVLRAKKRAKASEIVHELRMIDNAVAVYAIKNNKAVGDKVTVVDWTKELKPDSNLAITGMDVLGNPYNDQTVGSFPRVPTASKQALSDVANDAFWSPYQ